ncbi:MAG: hypothetical protein J6N21_13315 [Butyrivibrio sp.]|nr:hypothetical protein [Butyrivibrio sp.]
MSNKYTQKRKESNKRYMEKLSRTDVWLTPEEKEDVKDKAKAEGKSLSGYIRNKLGLKEKPLTNENKGEEDGSEE